MDVNGMSVDISEFKAKLVSKMVSDCRGAGVVLCGDGSLVVLGLWCVVCGVWCLVISGGVSVSC